MGRFPHERLDVYQAAIQFVAWAQSAVEGPGVTGPMRDQLSRAAASIPLNIAEGNARLAGGEQRRYLGFARGSTFECAACLDVLVARTVLAEDGVAHGKELLGRITAMLTAMMKASGNRIAEAGPDCLADDIERTDNGQTDIDFDIDIDIEKCRE